MSFEERTNLIKKYIIEEYDYERMIAHDCDAIDESKSYDEFLDWNIQCILECDEKEYISIEHLCNKIKNTTIAQMDMESCVVWDSSNIFFGVLKNLIVVHPR
jgi:hypothetical protein